MITGTDRGERAPYGEDLALAKEATLRLLAYCHANDWAGYDPYDGLNSRVFEALPFLHFRLARLGLTQAMKRSPINFRPLLLVPRTQNPKGLALFLAALLKLNGLGLLEQKQKELVPDLARKLAALRSPDSSYWCWGYSFPWQTRTLLVPRDAPNLVCTVFVANALLHLYETSGEARFLDMAASAGDYLVERLYWSDTGQAAGFSYPVPMVRTRVHNVNFLGAALLCRIYKHLRDPKYLEVAFKVARYSANRQKEDGSWPYGELPKQGWIDNFHTGYNLSGLRVLGECAGTSEFESRVRRGFAFYRQHFFLEEGTPRYFHNNTYPIDAHCVAQSIVSLIEFKHLDPDNVRLARSVFDWAMNRLWEERGFFCYRVLPYCTIRTSYMRWSQAWMFLALATLTKELAEPGAVKTRLVA